ncbi:IclR family transcriptional regulator [Microbacterium sp. Root61]|uniref:IclR family transcriptional regulator n=1 Tax=Microbacterium sp. Root61 TaxID=1736570 RepID=UPI000AB83146|nr:helix-turn-helix domain-containing protein [Microbacterium sp. Root61]
MKGPGSPGGVTLALAVLEEVARSGPALTANGIARVLEIPRASAYRLINSLVSEEYLLRHPTSDGFVLGARVVELAHLIAPLQRVRAPHLLDELRADTGEAIHYVRYTRGRVVVVDEDPAFPLASIDRTRRQLASTAIGRLLLSSVPTHPSSPLPPPAAIVAQTARSSGVSAREHEEIVAEVEATGFARFVDPDPEGRACVAVPVRSRTGELVAAVAISVARDRAQAALENLERLRVASSTLARVAEGELASAGSPR